MTAWTAETWIAIGTLTTAVVALAAGVAAFWQVREMRRTREDEARPYPAVFMESHRDNPQLVDLVVKNFGSTSAYSITVEFEPPLRRSDGEGGSDVAGTFEELPVLVPNQDWRTLWDIGKDRLPLDLPLRHEAVLRFKNERLEEFVLDFVLDWSVYHSRIYVDRKSIHHGAEALQQISKTLKRTK